MLQIQTALLQNNCSFSFSAIISYLQSLSKPLLLSDSTTFHRHLLQIQRMLSELRTLKGRRLAQAYSLVDMLFFNLSITLERTRIVFENMLVESTGTEEFDQKKVIETAEQIQKDINGMIHNLLDSKALQEILLVLKNQTGAKCSELSSLAETLQFISSKYSHSLPSKTKQSISHLLIPCAPLDSSSTKQIESLLNNHSSNLIEYLSRVEPSKHMSICMILHANDCKRPLFSSVIPTHHIITNIANHMLKHSKHLLFSNQHYNSSPHYKFLVSYMMFQFTDIVIKFNTILLKFSPQSNDNQYYTQNLPLFQQITNLLQLYSPSPLSFFLHTIFKVVNTKYSTEDSVQIMKLLFLNRFLLNPETHSTISPLTHHFTLHANKIKNIFFPSKLKHIEEIKASSIASYAILSKFCQSSEKSTPKTLFVPDKILRLCLSEISDKPQASSAGFNHSKNDVSSNNSIQSKNLLRDLDLRSESDGGVGVEEMMQYLIEYKEELRHRNRERVRSNKVIEESDITRNQEFMSVSNRFKDWKQQVMETKRAYKNNALVQF